MPERDDSYGLQREDDALLAAAARGDRPALGTLLDREQQALWRFCYRATSGHRADAEDVLQETFFRAIRGWATFRAERSLRAWLLGIAARVIVDRSRRTVSASRLHDEPTTCDAPRDEPDGALLRALAALTAETRAAILLRYVEEMTWREIATVLGIPIETVKKRIQRGRAVLEERLTADPKDQDHAIPR